MTLLKSLSPLQIRFVQTHMSAAHLTNFRDGTIKGRLGMPLNSLPTIKSTLWSRK